MMNDRNKLRIKNDLIKNVVSLRDAIKIKELRMSELRTRKDYFNNYIAAGDTLFLILN